MRLRKLKTQDSNKMISWMNNPNVVRYMGANFRDKTERDCIKFIENSIEDNVNIHFAIVNEQDEYMGTVSLKSIDYDNKYAEFAIILCEEAMGKGYSEFGMKKIIKYGFEELNLERIYWCVSKINERAVRFYNKNGYKQINEPLKEYYLNRYDEEQILSFYWYEVNKTDQNI